MTHDGAGRDLTGARIVNTEHMTEDERRKMVDAGYAEELPGTHLLRITDSGLRMMQKLIRTPEGRKVVHEVAAEAREITREEED